MPYRIQMAKWPQKRCFIWVSFLPIPIFAFSETMATFQVWYWHMNTFTRKMVHFLFDSSDFCCFFLYLEMCIFEFLAGMDFAHVFNGYRYHTKYDHIDYIPPEVLQRTGDNILALVQRIANSDELTNTEVKRTMFSTIELLIIQFNINQKWSN